MIIRPLPLGLAAALFAAPALGQLPQSPPDRAPPDRAPPEQVGRIAAVTGAVSFHLAGGTEWQAASQNLPVTTGMAFWVAPAAKASIGVSGARVVMGPSTALEVERLDALGLAGTQSEGESYWHIRAVAAGETYVVHTPRGTVTLATVGRYEVVSGDTEHPTAITVLEGAAALTDVARAEQVGPGQTLTVTGDGSGVPFAASLGPAVQDGFLRHVLAEEAPARPRPAASIAQTAAPAIVAQMAGSEPLYEVGQWSESAEYGPVWYPPAVDYVPYRAGRWAYVAPWGWTWVDDAPWGFAPSHYGRWSQFGGRWGWVPGRDWAPGRPPVYAPALVGFIGGAALGAGFGLAHGAFVGSAPLGPRDAYRPPYRVDDRTIQILNQPTGATVQINNRPVTINRSAVTIVPTQVLTTSAPVSGAFRPGSAASIGVTPVLLDRPQAAPTRATIGATRAVLQQVNPIGLTAAPGHAGAGPSIERPSVASPLPERQQVGSERQQLGLQRPQVGPGAIFGGAAAGAAAGAGGLLRQRAGAPEPGAIARPMPPTRPSLLDPSVPNGRRGGDLLQSRPPLFRQPVIPGPAPVAVPVRPELPRVLEGGPLPREHLPVIREAPPVPLRQEVMRPPPPQARMAPPPRELQRPPPQQVGPPRRPEERPERRPER